MLDRRRQALLRLRMFIVGEVAFFVATLLFTVVYYGGGRGGWTLFFSLFVFLLINFLTAVTYPLWRQGLDFPVENLLRQLRAGTDADRFRMHVRQAHAHVDAGRDAAAYRELQAASALRSEDTEVLFELAELCERGSRAAAAARYYRRIIELGSLHAPIRRLTQARERLDALGAATE